MPLIILIKQQNQSTLYQSTAGKCSCLFFLNEGDAVFYWIFNPKISDFSLEHETNVGRCFKVSRDIKAHGVPSLTGRDPQPCSPASPLPSAHGQYPSPEPLGGSACSSALYWAKTGLLVTLVTVLLGQPRLVLFTCPLRQTFGHCHTWSHLCPPPVHYKLTAQCFFNWSSSPMISARAALEEKCPNKPVLF